MIENYIYINVDVNDRLLSQTRVFSLVCPKWGVGWGISPNPNFPYQKKTGIFWLNGGSYLFQKGFIIIY